MGSATADSGRPRQAAAAALRALREAVFPARCLECRRFLPAAAAPGRLAADGPSEAVAALKPFFCRDCLRGVTPVEHPFCPRCGVMFRGRSGDDHLCGRCLEQPPWFHMARAAFVYHRSLIDVIHCLKYKGKSRLAAPLGRLLQQAFERHWGQERVDLILPVPLHGRRLRRRGFNQAQLLTRAWDQVAGRPHSPPVADGVLRRCRATAPQAGLGRRGRERNIRGAFVVRQPQRIAGKHLLLVDDVITTGATAGECARLLLESGAARVDVLALARVI